MKLRKKPPEVLTPYQMYGANSQTKEFIREAWMRMPLWVYVVEEITDEEEKAKAQI